MKLSVQPDKKKGVKIMSKLFSINWWISQFITVFITMVFIYIIKLILGKVNVPIASNIAESV